MACLIFLLSDSSKSILTNPLLSGLSETQITEIFSSVGRVVCFRIVFDRDTGRSKGYGFAEYIDAETAASAVRNLDNYEIMGRKLRVDYSSQGYVGKELGFSKEGLFPQLVYGKDDHLPKNDLNYSSERAAAIAFSDGGYLNVVNGSESGHSSHSSHITRYDIPTQGTPKGMTAMNTYPNHTNPNSVNSNHADPNPVNTTNINETSSLLPNLPLGTDNHPGLTSPDSISKTLSVVPVSQLLRILIQMKDLAVSDPARATELLRQAPQLSYAIFQAFIMMNLVEPTVLAQLLDPNNTASMYNQTQISMSAHLLQHQSASVNMGAHSQKIPHQTAPIPTRPPPAVQTQQLPSFYGYPTARGTHAHPVPYGGHSGQELFPNQPVHQQQQQTRMQAAIEPDKAVLLQRVMVLSPEEIGRLPAEQQQQVLLLKHRLMTGGMGAANLQTGY